MKKGFAKISKSILFQAIITIAAYILYVFIFALCIAPSIILILKFIYPLWMKIINQGIHVIDIVKLTLTLAASFYLFAISGIFILGSIIRLASWRIKPGRYRLTSFTFFRWLFFSGVYNFAIQLVLPMVRMTFFTNIFYTLVGCKMGKNVKLNSWTLPDAYLLEIGDNVIIGAKTEITCHVVEGKYLLLKNIKIGSNTLIGAHCYISPGVEIGNRCVIGLNSMVRKNVNLPDRTKIAGIAGLPLHEVYDIEKKAFIYKDKNEKEINETA